MDPHTEKRAHLQKVQQQHKNKRLYPFFETAGIDEWEGVSVGNLRKSDEHHRPRYVKTLNLCVHFSVTDIFALMTQLIQFGQVLASKLSGFKSGHKGYCLYQDRRVIERNIGQIDLKSLRADDGAGNIDMGKMFRMLGEIDGSDVFFVKDLDALLLCSGVARMLTGVTLSGAVQFSDACAMLWTCRTFLKIRALP